MSSIEQCFVCFSSPGTFVHETTERPIAKWDTVTACEMSRDITERYGAKPFGFTFSRCLVHDPISDGQGGLLNVQRKEIERSGMHFLGGTLLMLDELENANDPDMRTLRGNMRCNDWPIVIENRNSWRSIQPFDEGDKIVGDEGEILRSGDEPELVSYRGATIGRVRNEDALPQIAEPSPAATS